METANSTDPDQNAPVMSRSKSTRIDKEVSKTFQCTIKQKTFWPWYVRPVKSQIQLRICAV